MKPAPLHLYCVPQEVLYRPSERGGVVVNVRSGNCWELNETGSLFWSIVAEGGTVAEAVASIVRAFAVDPVVVTRDVENLLLELTNQRLLVLK